MTFTTTGYGDFSPSTPAGRSVFVVWALLGVGTMTILISVLQEAGSNKYKDVLHSRMFDDAVKKFRKRQNDETNLITKQRNFADTLVSSEDIPEDILRASREAAQKELETLPGEIIKQTRTFHQHLQFFVNHGTGGSGYDQNVPPGQENKLRVPHELKALLREVSQLENIGVKTQREILHDEDSRKTLFLLSVECSLRAMINAAERSLASLAERDGLISLQQQRQANMAGIEEETRVSKQSNGSVGEPPTSSSSSSHSS